MKKMTICIVTCLTLFSLSPVYAGASTNPWEIHDVVTSDLATSLASLESAGDHPKFFVAANDRCMVHIGIRRTSDGLWSSLYVSTLEIPDAAQTAEQNGFEVVAMGSLVPCFLNELKLRVVTKTTSP